VNIPKNAQVALKMGNKIVPTSCHLKTFLVTLLDPNETVFIFWLVYVERDQGPRLVADSTPCLSTWLKGTTRKGEVGAEKALHRRDSLSTTSAVPLPPLEIWGYSVVARACEEQRDKQYPQQEVHG
jgi:hypothetical protein